MNLPFLLGAATIPVYLWIRERTARELGEPTIVDRGLLPLLRQWLGMFITAIAVFLIAQGLQEFFQ
jgi:hypothetical protein